jgi:hypothetical protein
MFPLKPLSKDAVPAALAKAERYRLLNEPGEAESICLDIQQVDPDNQDALVTLILALTDQFPDESPSARRSPSRATELVSRLHDEYERHYYNGIIRERRAKAALHHRGSYAFAAAAVEWLREAMAFYERAEAIRPAHNDDAVLRWNACARLLQELPDVKPDTQAEPIESE